MVVLSAAQVIFPLRVHQFGFSKIKIQEIFCFATSFLRDLLKIQFSGFGKKKKCNKKLLNT